MLGMNDFVVHNSHAMKDLLDTLSASSFKPASQIASRGSKSADASQSEIEIKDAQLVPIRGLLKLNSLKLLYYYLSTHSQAVVNTAGEAKGTEAALL